MDNSLLESWNATLQNNSTYIKEGLMKYNNLGTTGIEISEISLGTWQVGGVWGTGFDKKNAEKIINEAIDNGVNFIDTADVYEDGKSEAIVGEVIRKRKEKIYIATKCGRRIMPHVNEGYTLKTIEKFIDDSLENTGLDTLNLIQLHCPPTQVFYRPEIFDLFERLKQKGKIQNLGVSVEKVEEAIKAIEYPNVKTVQIIFNIFRQRPRELFFKLAKEKNIGVIVRVPFASGLLTGKFGKDTKFNEKDHRFGNREGKWFDKGETFAGIDFELGVKLAEELKTIFGTQNIAPYTLKWILMHKEVSTVIPGASKSGQILKNIEVPKLKNIPQETLNRIDALYDLYLRNTTHQMW